MSKALALTIDTSGARAMIERKLRAILAVPVAAVECAKEAQLLLTERTPRSDQHYAGEHTADMWMVRVIDAGKVVEVTHPFNTVGATHPGTGNVVNDGTHNLLATLEFGSKPHIILASGSHLHGLGGKPLKYFIPGLGWRSSYMVNHPGTRAHHFLRDTSEIIRAMFKARVEELLRRPS